MRVNKLIMTVTAAFLFYMSATVYYGINNGVDLFINHSTMFMYVRLGLIGALALLFFTQVPRSIATRMFVGIISAILLLANAYYVLDATMAPLDGMMFSVVAIILGIEALEYEPETNSEKQLPANA